MTADEARHLSLADKCSKASPAQVRLFCGMATDRIEFEARHGGRRADRLFRSADGKGVPRTPGPTDRETDAVHALLRRDGFAIVDGAAHW